MRRTPFRPGLPALAGSVLLCGLVGACSGADGGYGVQRDPTGPHIRWATHEPRAGEAIPDAQLIGVLTEVDGCILVVDELGYRSLAVFPAGKVSYDVRSETLKVLRSSYQLGSAVTFQGGGYYMPFPGIQLNGCDGAANRIYLVYGPG